MKEKVILTDCDGVLVDWVYAFDCYLQSHGYEKVRDDVYDLEDCYVGITREKMKELIKHFNESAAIGFLPPFRDAMYYVRKLHEEHGFVFHCITSLSKNQWAGKLREMNLVKLFGETVFEKVVCLDTGADKDEALAEYKDSGCYWIEDKIENAELGVELGLNSIILEQTHTDTYKGDIPVMKNWKEIYHAIV